jgi:hypothetical protein
VTRLITDGGYLSGSAGAGIVLADDSGRVIATRAVSFAATSSFEAEARAVWLADRMAEERGLGALPVYNDNLDAIPWARAIGIDAHELPFVAGARRSRGPLHRLAHRLAIKARQQPSGWRIDFEGRPPGEFYDPTHKVKRTPGPNAGRALRVRIATRLGGYRVAEIMRASLDEARTAAAAEIRTERRQGRAVLGGRSPSWVGYRGTLYDPTSPSFDWWHVWAVTWRELALHHYYTATAGCYTPRRAD